MKPDKSPPGPAGLRTRASVQPENPPQSASTEPPGPAGLRTRAFDQPNPPPGQSASTEPRDPSAEPRDPGQPRGWHWRGYMPHFDSHDVIQHVTFHLVDSLPKDVLALLLEEIQQLDPDQRDTEKRLRLEVLVDAGHGACWLQQPECARIVQDALLHFDDQRYRLLAWVVMPNHVHALFQPMNGSSMGSVVRSWKTFTANAIGQLVRKANEPVPRVWHPEFWDRYIRNEKHFANTIAYIHDNPVKAGLVTHPEQWPWSSASTGNAGLGPAGLRTRAFDQPANPPQSASTEPREPSAEPRVPRDGL